ncbi:hypothetical protein QMP26_27215 [Enterocloster clostridioformis]|uniref:hypothetical protein n=1 Tax=Enterocloster clostridioformis TaxID=1531 RepID=UPI002676F8BF|nr:hypothetical protein [Enterocloster clostridioformis]
MVLNETYSLSNGVKIPKLGLGTWFISDREVAAAVREGIILAGVKHWHGAAPDRAYFQRFRESLRQCGCTGGHQCPF